MTDDEVRRMYEDWQAAVDAGHADDDAAQFALAQAMERRRKAKAAKRAAPAENAESGGT